MTQINTEKLLPATFETVAPAEAASSIPYDQLIADTSAVQDAIEWGMDKEDPIINDLWSAVHGEHGGGWVRKGGVIVCTTLGGGQNVLIRESEASSEIETLRESLRKVMTPARIENDTRHNYDRNIGYAKGDHGKNQKRNAIKTGVLSSLGSVAMGYGFPLLNEAAKLMAYQPNPLYLAGGFAIGSVMSGAGSAANIYRKYRNQVKQTENPQLAERGEAVFEQLSPALHVLAEAYDGKMRPGDILLQNKTYEMDLKEVKKLLKEPGGPELEEFEAVLEDLGKIASKEKVGKKGQRSVRDSLTRSLERYSAMYEFGMDTFDDLVTNDLPTDDDKEKRGRHYTYNPAKLVKKMISDTGGEIWNDEFAERVRRIASAQEAIEQKETGADKVKQLTSNVLGVDEEEHTAGLKLDIENLHKTIDLEMLRVLKLQAQYVANRAAAASTAPIQDPYVETAVAAQKDATEVPLQLEAQTSNFSEGWPLIERTHTEEERDKEIA